jgi:hypothetical protein
MIRTCHHSWGRNRTRKPGHKPARNCHSMARSIGFR